ncbi:hypothetical protein [Spirulina sp. 06S082]|uniref:hypothetical protein n=1 Tax=Spirulina sp. 06S082 TaxID=3110248 RepID=UPI002B1F1D0B|nr:hypothetical protein [Spirulina sp. 06S082]MEA5468600.1 hypothetical protein [Spirulina sp. 06S082]
MITNRHHTSILNRKIGGLFLVIFIVFFPIAVRGQSLSLKPEAEKRGIIPHIDKPQEPLFSQNDETGEPFLPIHRQPIDPQPFQPEILPLLPQKAAEQDSSVMVSPSITVVTPSAYGASWGNAAIGVGLQSRTRFSDRADGIFGIKVGLGDATETIGAEIVLTLVDLDSFFSDGSISFKIHRQLPDNFNIAVGVQGATNFGLTDGGSSIYGVLTRRFFLSENPQDPFSQFYLSVGVGGGQFRSEDDVINGVNSVGIFGSASVRVTEWSSAIAEWTGQDLTVGFSFVPFADVPLVIVPAITDITGTAGDGTRFLFSAGYSFEF